MIYIPLARSILRTFVAAFIAYALFRAAHTSFEIAVISLLILIYLAVRSTTWKEPPPETPNSIQFAIWPDTVVDGVNAFIAVLALISLGL